MENNIEGAQDDGIEIYLDNNSLFTVWTTNENHYLFATFVALLLVEDPFWMLPIGF
jgi:hypothetical protein